MLILKNLKINLRSNDGKHSKQKEKSLKNTKKKLQKNNSNCKEKTNKKIK